MEKMQEKVKPYYELMRKKQRLRKLHEQLFGKQDEIKQLKERIDTLYNAFKETVKPKREPKKEILFKINSLESKMDNIYFREIIRPKDQQKIKNIQNRLHHLYESLNEYDDKKSVIGAGPVLPIMPEEREPRKVDPETHEKIVPQPGDQPSDKIEKDYPQAYGPNKQIENIRKRLFTMHEDMKGDKHPDSEFDANELEMGTKHEMEHTDDPAVAKKTAKDHLLENPKYYTDLKKAGLEKLTPTEMEDKAEQIEFSTKEIQDDKKRNEVLMYAKELRNKANRTRATKMTEKQAPEGWVIVDWKDNSNHKWQDVVPRGAFAHFQMRVMQSGGVITKTQTESMDWNPMDNKSVELENLKEGYIEYNDPYFAMQALHILVANDIDVTPKDNRLYVSHKDEAKVRDIFKKMGYNTPMFQEKLKEYLEPHKGKLTDPISNAEEKHKFKTDAQRRKTISEAERKYKNALVDYENLVKKIKADEPGPITALGAGIELGQAKSDIDYWFTTIEWAKKGYSFEAYNHFEISDIWKGEKMNKENYNEKDWKKRLDIVAKQCDAFKSTNEDTKQVASKGITQMKEKFRKKEAYLNVGDQAIVDDGGVHEGARVTILETDGIRAKVRTAGTSIKFTTELRNLSKFPPGVHEEQINVSGEPDKTGPGKMVLRGEEKIKKKIEKMHEGIVKKEQRGWQKGDEVVDVHSKGRKGIVVGAGYSWADVKWEDGEKEDSVAGHRLKLIEESVIKEKHHPLWEPPKVDVNPELAKDWDPISAISGGNIIKTPEEKRKLTQEAERELKKAEDKYEKALQGKDPDNDEDGRRRERNYWFTVLTWAKKGYKNP